MTSTAPLLTDCRIQTVVLANRGNVFNANKALKQIKIVNKNSHRLVCALPFISWVTATIRSFLDLMFCEKQFTKMLLCFLGPGDISPSQKHPPPKKAKKNPY